MPVGAGGRRPPRQLLSELYPGAPVVNLFEDFYHATGSDLDSRPDSPSDEASRLRAKARNAITLLDLNGRALGHCTTAWQRSSALLRGVPGETA